MAEAAMDLAHNGWCVLPLRGKEPLTSHGVHDATSDLATVRAWWERWPYANIGARVPDFLLVLDIDPRHDGDHALAALADEHGGLPLTLTMWSGRGDGGRHLYFVRPAGRVTTSGVPFGVDVKVNGYCVMPPSQHPATGRPYTWEHHDVARLPPWLRTLLTPAPHAYVPKGVRVSERDLDGLVAQMASRPDGQRNRFLYYACCRALGCGRENLLPALGDAALSAGLSNLEVARTVDSARRRPVRGARS